MAGDGRTVGEEKKKKEQTSCSIDSPPRLVIGQLGNAFVELLCIDDVTRARVGVALVGAEGVRQRLHDIGRENGMLLVQERDAGFGVECIKPLVQCHELGGEHLRETEQEVLDRATERGVGRRG